MVSIEPMCIITISFILVAFPAKLVPAGAGHVRATRYFLYRQLALRASVQKWQINAHGYCACRPARRSLQLSVTFRAFFPSQAHLVDIRIVALGVGASFHILCHRHVFFHQQFIHFFVLPCPKCLQTQSNIKRFPRNRTINIISRVVICIFNCWLQVWRPTSIADILN